MVERATHESGTPEDAFAWLFAHICNTYFLEMTAVLAEIFGGDLTKGLVFLTISRANVAHLEQGLGGDASPAADGAPPPDRLRVPTTTYEVAKALGLTYETARRHVNWLIEKGFCTRTADGLVIPAATLDAPVMVRARRRNRANFERFMVKLRSVGLDHPEPATEPPASLP